MRKLLVTGGAGFIGGNFVHYWHAHHPHDLLVVLDVLSYSGHRETLAALESSPRMRFVHGDILDGPLLDSLFAEHDIDTVVHFAAESHVDRSIRDPGAFVRTNVSGTQSLLDAARRAWFANGAWRASTRFHHVSTDEVYGSLAPHDPPFTEQTPYAPRSPYAASKAASDHLVRASQHTYGLPTTISNCSNNYGPFQYPEKLIALAIVHALDGKPIPLYGDGQQVRDWLFVDDHCIAIDHILERGVVGETYNVGGREERANADILHLICGEIDRQFGRDATLAQRFPHSAAAQGRPSHSQIQHVADRPGHDRRYAIDPRHIAGTLGFEPSNTLEQGLAKTVAWYLQNEAWWRGVMDQGYRDWMQHQYAAPSALSSPASSSS